MKVNISGHSAQGIFESIRELTSNGQLVAGDALPPVRELAEQLGVNRNTVSAAYQRLATAGIAVTQGRLGTRISQQPNAGEQEGVTDTALFDLADGSPRREWLPDLNDVASHTKLNQFLYGEATILPQIIDYATSWFAGTCPKDFAITLCNGAIDTLERMMLAHLVPGDKVVVEDPCYISSANAIRLAGMRVVGAMVDEFGMRPEALQSALEKGAKAVLITPRAHNPTGASLSSERAAELRAVLSKYPSVLVLEDDHFSLLATTEYYSVIPDSSYHWAVFRSVSKGLGPDLRLAFVAADKESVKRITTRLAPGMSWVSRVLQSFVYTCLTKSVFQLHLSDAKDQCAHARTMLIDSLAEQDIPVAKTSDGLNVWVAVGKDCQATTFALSRKGWLVRPGSSFDIENLSQAIRVSVQNLDENSARRFAQDVAEIIAS
ncbi:aminotransferase class I/II-fold pyridoxal phosphate-dependent enzyme [Aliiglaciecola sp. M165]|uniref:aminotransferase class I/II-fold pyridoxal phosphate-dependent enzyme n=1 Tax=Aliiglaciecola sp. M165 TaxID=2593649 RepID=UPI00117D669B|nr:aminotransferase class I/II-fold pyridoxal phosphate-dependent enzyme [Aliiglaciecola sp. M165]TRY33322.1 aminotransferase class I/II-fold pyridoxal phosphate-dependent enzyme [Aliiglaciecola sp. M165]